jgi:hypothetical protein
MVCANIQDALGIVVGIFAGLRMARGTEKVGQLLNGMMGIVGFI